MPARRKERLARTEQALRSDDPDAKVITGWLGKNIPRHWAAVGLGLDFSINRLSYEMDFRPLTLWEKSTVRARKAHLEAVTRHAEALISLLTAEARPYHPPALALFDERQAIKIAETMKGDLEALCMAPLQLAPKDQDYARGDSINARTFSVASVVSSVLSIQTYQSIEGLLHNLVEWIKQETEESVSHPRSPRPNTDGADRRALAAHLGRYFSREYGKTPNGVIACAVNLAFPDADPPATEDLVRTWRGVR